MNKTSVVALGIIFSFLSLSQVVAQEYEDPLDDPLAGIDDLMSEIENLESESTDEFANPEADSNIEVETEAEGEGQLETETENESESENEIEDTSRVLSSRVSGFGEIPEGKENHLLYRVPGAIEYGGMTFLRIDSPKFFNRFQPCDTSAEQKLTNRLAMLKISQGAPLECREDMKYQFMPYQTFRASR